MSPTDIPRGSAADEPPRDAAGEAASRAERADEVEAAPADRAERPGEAVGADVPADQDAEPAGSADVDAADEQHETAVAAEPAAGGPGEDEFSVTVVDAAEETEFEVPAYASIAEQPIGVSDAVDSDAPEPADPAELARIAREHAEMAEALHGAVDVARSAAEEDAGPELVGEYVGVQPEDAAAVTHLFEARNPGYVGWRWAVTVACAGPDAPVTVSEVVLLPGPDALTAPEWVPWQDRVQAGDLGVGDLFPARKDDPRLVAGYVQSDDPAVEEVALELGLGRVRVLSREGRLEAAARWADGEFGPRSDMARGAPGPCGTCGFYQQVAGLLGGAFGVCANDISPADGRVVHVQYGCGAHSEVEVDTAPMVAVAELVYDDARLDYEPALNAQPGAPATEPKRDPTPADSATEPDPAEVTETSAEPTDSAIPATAEPAESAAEPKPDEPVSDTSAAQPHAAEVTETPAGATDSTESATTESTTSEPATSESATVEQGTGAGAEPAHPADSPDAAPGTSGD